MRRRALLSAARTALLTTPLAALAGCSGFGSDATDSPTDTQHPTESPTPSPTPTPATIQTPADAPLTVAEHAMEHSNEGSDSEMVAVNAVVRNTSDAVVSDVRVIARFLDEDGSLLDESSAQSDRIAADGRWEVELLFPGSGDDARTVADYRILLERDD